MNVRDLRVTKWYWCDNKVHDLYGSKIGALAFAVYNSLCRHANQNGQCWPSANAVASSLGISEKTIYRSIKKLVEYDLIKIQSGASNGDSNVYIINDVPLDPQSYPSVPQSYLPRTVSPTNNTNITIHNNNTDSLETKTPNKVLKTKGAVEAKEPKESSGHQEVIAHFVNAYQVKTGNKYLFTGRDAKEISNMLQVTDKDDLMERIDVFFASNDPFYSKAGYTTGVLSAVINKLSTSKPVASGAAGRTL